MDGSITKLLDIGRATYNVCNQANAVYINIETPSQDSCVTTNYDFLYDSLFRIVCCIHKELNLSTALRLITGDVYDPNKDLVYKNLKTILGKILVYLESNCLTLIEGIPCQHCDETDCNCNQLPTNNCNSGCNSSCVCCTTTNEISNLKMEMVTLKNKMADYISTFNQYKFEVDSQVTKLLQMQPLLTAMQEFYGSHLACLRKLCVLEGCFDCKVNYSIFSPQPIFAGVVTPLNFDIKVTDNDPSYVSNGGWFRYCPPENGNYKVEITDISLAPAKYCAGDKIEIISSVSGVVYTYTVSNDSLNLIVQLPDINLVENYSGGCLSYSIKITSKDYVQRNVSAGNIVLYKLL